MISLAIPTRNSERFIGALIKQIDDLAGEIEETIEVIIVDDASNDSTLKNIYETLKFVNSRNLIFSLFQNFSRLGQQKNSLLSLVKTNGEKIFLVEDDIQFDRSILYFFLNATDSSTKIDLVIGTQKKSGKGEISSWVFWKIIKALTRGQIPEREMLLRMFTRESLNSLIENGQANWTVTENCNRLFVRKKYIQLESVKYLKGTTRHSLVNRLTLSIEIFLRFLRLGLVGITLLVALMSASFVALIYFLTSSPDTVSYWPLTVFSSLAFCISGFIFVLSTYQILVDSVEPIKSLPSPKRHIY